MSEVAASGRVDGGVDGVGAPLDEERKQAVDIVLQVESFPLEEATVGAFSRAGIGAVEGDVCVAETSCELVEVAGMCGPADEARLDELRQTVMDRRAWLLRIGGDDFEVAARVEFFAAAFAQRNERVARASPGMNAAECSANAGMFFNEVDAAIEIAAAEEDVIKHDGDLIACRHEFGSQREAGGGCDKKSA